MADEKLRRLCGLTGIAFVVLSSVVGVIAPPWPPAGSGQDVIVTYFVTYREPFLIGNYLAAVASLPGFVQVATLALIVRGKDAEGGWLWLGMLSSSLVAHAVGIVVLAAFQAPVFVATGPGVSAVIATSELANVGFGFFNIALAGAEFLTGLALWRTRPVRAWLGAMSIGLSGLTLIASAGGVWPSGVLTPGGPITIVSFFAFLVWMLLLSLGMLRKAPAQGAGQLSGVVAGRSASPS